MKFKVFLVLGTCLLTACSGMQVADKNLGHAINQTDRTVIVFSVENAGPLSFDSLMIAAPRENGIPIKQGTVTVDNREPGVQVFAVSLPAGQNQVALVRFRTGDDWYEVADLGLKFTAAPGALHYLGRLSVSNVRLARYADSGRAYPHSVRLNVSDQRIADRTLLSEQYQVPDTVRLEMLSLDQSIEGEYVALQPWLKSGRRWPYDYHEAYGFSVGGPVGPELPPQRSSAGQN